jgi:hypothetical protein
MSLKTVEEEDSGVASNLIFPPDMSESSVANEIPVFIVPYSV